MSWASRTLANANKERTEKKQWEAPTHEGPLDLFIRANDTDTYGIYFDSKQCNGEAFKRTLDIVKKFEVPGTTTWAHTYDRANKIWVQVSVGAR